MINNFMKDKEKCELALNSIQSFFNKFDDEKHAHIMLEILFKELLNEKTIPLSSQQKKGRDKTNNSS